MSKSKTPKARKWTGAIWTLAILLLIGAVLWYGHRAKQLVQTGDQLLDEYVAAVWARIDSKPPRSEGHDINQVYAALEDVIKWEDEYAADPRYWQLRFLLEFNKLWYENPLNRPDQVFADELAIADPPPSLEPAEALKYSGETQWLLHQFQLAEERDLNDALILLAIRDEIGEELPLERDLAMSLAALEADPEDSRAQRRWGFSLLADGNYDQALGFFKRCNVSSKPLSNYLYPLPEITSTVGQGKILGNVPCSSALSVVDVTILNPVRHLENRLDLWLTPETLLENPELFQEMYLATCRLVLEGDSLDSMVCWFAVRDAAELILNNERMWISVAQKETLYRVTEVVEQITWYDMFHGGTLVGSGPLYKIPIVGIGLSRRELRKYHKDEYQLLEDDIRPLIRLLMEVDFTTLETPPGLVGFEGPYPDE